MNNDLYLDYKRQQSALEDKILRTRRLLLEWSNHAKIKHLYQKRPSLFNAIERLLPALKEEQKSLERLLEDRQLSILGIEAADLCKEYNVE